MHINTATTFFLTTKTFYIGEEILAFDLALTFCYCLPADLDAQQG